MQNNAIFKQKYAPMAYFSCFYWGAIFYKRYNNTDCRLWFMIWHTAWIVQIEKGCKFLATNRPQIMHQSLAMDHRVFRFATRGQCIKGKKLDCFEHKFCFKLQCASIVVLLCTAIWWKSKDAVVHLHNKDFDISWP